VYENERKKKDEGKKRKEKERKGGMSREAGKKG
jgi:hypothetical protein